MEWTSFRADPRETNEALIWLLDRDNIFFLSLGGVLKIRSALRVFLESFISSIVLNCFGHIFFINVYTKHHCGRLHCSLYQIICFWYSFQLDDSFDNTNRRFLRRIQESEVRETLKRMKGGKAMGPDGIPIEVWRCLGDIAIVWLTKLFNHIFRSNKMPDEWRRSILVPIYKNKGDNQSCTNYRGIKLMSHIMKLWERVIEHRLRAITRVSMNQFGFMPGRSTIEAIFLIRHVMERYREKKKDLHMVFIDLEKAYDKIPMNVMWWVLDKHKVPTKYVGLIKDMYNNVVTSVRTSD